MPAAPPQVTYSNGQLSIVSQNSTLRDILSMVRERTGASIEMPPGTASERVATQLGPGPARDVVTALLQGSRFDYIILGTMQDPAGLDRLILTPRGGSSPGAGGAQSGPSRQSATAAGMEIPATRAMPEVNAEEPVVEDEPQQPAPVPQAAPAEQNQTPQQPQVRTPEQLLQELRRMQQQQQQGPQRPDRPQREVPQAPPRPQEN